MMPPNDAAAHSVANHRTVFPDRTGNDDRTARRRRGIPGGGAHLRAGARPSREGVHNGATQAPHLDVAVFARGLLTRLVTRMYFPDEHEANDADPVLRALSAGERSTLVAVREDGGLRFDIRLQGSRETVFFDR